jgi:hypothetical protein
MYKLERGGAGQQHGPPRSGCAAPTGKPKRRSYEGTLTSSSRHPYILYGESLPPLFPTPFSCLWMKPPYGDGKGRPRTRTQTGPTSTSAFGQRLGGDVKVILTPPYIFILRISNEIYSGVGMTATPRASSAPNSSRGTCQRCLAVGRRVIQTLRSTFQ